MGHPASAGGPWPPNSHRAWARSWWTRHARRHHSNDLPAPDSLPAERVLNLQIATAQALEPALPGVDRNRLAVNMPAITEGDYPTPAAAYDQQVRGIPHEGNATHISANYAAREPDSGRRRVHARRTQRLPPGRQPGLVAAEFGHSRLGGPLPSRRTEPDGGHVAGRRAGAGSVRNDGRSRAGRENLAHGGSRQGARQVRAPRAAVGRPSAGRRSERGRQGGDVDGAGCVHAVDGSQGERFGAARPQLPVPA